MSDFGFNRENVSGGRQNFLRAVQMQQGRGPTWKNPQQQQQMQQQQQRAGGGARPKDEIMRRRGMATQQAPTVVTPQPVAPPKQDDSLNEIKNLLLSMQQQSAPPPAPTIVKEVKVEDDSLVKKYESLSKDYESLSKDHESLSKECKGLKQNLQFLQTTIGNVQNENTQLKKQVENVAKHQYMAEIKLNPNLSSLPLYDNELGENTIYEIDANHVHRIYVYGSMIHTDMGAFMFAQTVDEAYNIHQGYLQIFIYNENNEKDLLVTF